MNQDEYSLRLKEIQKLPLKKRSEARLILIDEMES